MSKAFQFLVEMGQDPYLRRSFASNRTAAIAERGFGAETERALLGGEDRAIRSAAGADSAYLPPKVIWAAG